MKERIINLLKTPKHQLRTLDEIYKDLNLTQEDEFDEVGSALEELENDFIITHNKQNQFALLEYFNLVKGVINIKDAGFGFVDGETFSVHISENNLHTAMSGDTVLVRFKQERNKSFEGEVVRIITRAKTFIVGPLKKHKNRFFVKGLINKINVWASIKDVDPKILNKVVKVEITKYYKYDQVEAKIKEVYGDEFEIGMDITMQVLASGVKYQFDDETIKEAKSIPQEVDINKYKNRHDLTKETIITIDGDDARDYDDAVTLKVLDNGNYLLKVCIADVSEYVKEGSFLDMEAYERGTSIYLPDRVIPMLPLELSNGICSLNEGVNRLVEVSEIELDKEAKIINTSFYEGIMKSSHRMTYSVVNKMIEDEDKEMIEKYQDIYEMLILMNNLSKKLYEKRIKRGSFDFETTEVKVNLDKNGNVIDLSYRERRSAEKLIEEFMLVANESVAEQMTWLDVPFIYRVHDEPDDERLNLFLTRLKSLKQEFSYKNKAALPKALQQFLINTNDENNPLEKTLKVVLSNTLLRTMSKAKYQEENIGHYGLASKCYTHFTSPIRRYPDLLVHRLMKQFLFNESETNKDPILYFTKKVHDTGIQASLKEKTAERLERDTTDMKKCEYMEQFMGKVFTGMISSVVNWGLYITLENTVEGLARFENLPYDYYEVDEKKGIIYGKKKDHIYRLGDVVKVKLIDINIEKHQITFKMLGKLENEDK